MKGDIHPQFIIRHCSTRAEAAEVYADALREYSVEWDGWPIVNREILRHWPKGLAWIKARAWKLAEIPA